MKHLDLPSNNKITDKKLKYVPNITKLNLHFNTNMTDDGLKYISNVTNLNPLMILYNITCKRYLLILLVAYKMAFCNINDINLELLSRITNFKLFIGLSILDKKSYILITNTLVYAELNILENYYNGKSNKKFNGKLIGNITIYLYYKLGLVNILQKLKKNNEYFISINGHIHILDW